MSVAELVYHLKSLDVRLKAEGSRLLVDAPKGVLSDRLRAQLAEHKQELLEFLRVNQPQDTFVRPPIERRLVEGPSSLSFAQERLWFLEQLEPGSAVYNICRAFRLKGRLNIEALEVSLTGILHRHEILRSRIGIVDGRPVQIMLALPKFEVSVIDLCSLTEPERDREVANRIKAETEWQFDFSAGLFLRAVLLQIRNDEHIIILTTHHIVADAWSMGILTRELWALYETYTNGRPSPLKELPVQYADYAFWQREWLQGEALESQLSYWRDQLKELPILNLPTDHPRPVKQSFRGARQPLSLPETLTIAVNELSGREGVTQFMTLLAAFQVLLYRYSGQEDVIVGSPIANRSGARIEHLIGFFVNTLVIRSDFSGNPSFREFLLRVREVCLGAYAHQDLPFEKLVEELRPERDLSRNPLFQVMFVLQNTPRPFQQPAGLSIERVDVLPATSVVDLSLYLRERDGKLIGFFEYNTDLFEPSTIERMIGHFETLLEGIVADPEQPISTLPLLTQAERHRVLVEWNDTETEYPKDVCIHELFEAQAARTPESIALEFEGKQLTYRELNRQANQLAHYLRGLGVGPEKLVGIYMERSLDMVVGLLGILKAGGAYVPLDPDYPRERLEFMLKDAQVSLLLTQEKLVQDRGSSPVLGVAEGMDDGESGEIIENGRWRVEDGAPRLRVVCLHCDAQLITERRQDDPASGVDAGNLAYVIYTSGSTGKPKGVEVSHGSVINCLQAMAQRLEFTAQDILLAVTTISFDIAASELYLPLLVGGKVVVAKEENSRDGRELVRRLTERSATAMQATPSTWRLLLEAGWQGSRDFKILCGGETLSRELAKRLLGCGVLWNLYGPTETTIWSTMHRVAPGDGPVYIGRPIANTQMYILDGHLQPVPTCVHGDLYIGGDGLARGYVGREDLTSERFVPNAFSDNPDARLYRTGDRARYRPDGTIEFLGRLDNQVKIRGHRVELGDIEATLNQHPAVKDSVVVLCSHELRTVVGYVVPRENSALSITEVRRYLKDKLPEYMLPSSFVVLAELPLMPNGKVDRRRLLPPDGTRPPVTGEFASPRTEIEELIAQTWQEVLKIENVGIYDNFFELGGHSLLATEIVARLQEAFNKDVPLRVLFDAPTIAELAQEFETIIRDGRAPELPPIVAVPRDGPLPLSMNQEHLWRMDQMMPGTHFFNMPYVYRLSGELNVEALEKALREIVRRHEAMRTVFCNLGGRPVQIIKDVLDFEFPVVELRGMTRDDLTKEATVLILEERVEPFDLAVGPLIRAKLLRLTDRETLLLVTAHHVIADHWSMQVFRSELITLYEAFYHGKPSLLPEPTIQFGDYACWERRLIDDLLFNDQLLFWENQLAGPVIESQHQASGDNSGEASFQFNCYSIEINEALLGELRVLAKKEKSTLFIVLLTALIAALHVCTGQREIRVGTLVANRRHPEIGATIGHFVNTVILTTHVLQQNTLKQLLRQVRDITLRAHMYQEFPMEQLMRELESKQQIDRACLYRVLINYQKHDSKPVNTAGLTFASWNVPYANSESEALPTAFDLIFNLKEISTVLTGAVKVRVAAVNGSNAADVGNAFTGILEIIVSESHCSMSNLSRILGDRA